MNEAHRSSNDASWTRLPLTNQVAEFHQGRWGIAKGEERIRMFLDSEADTCLSASDVFIDHFSDTRI